ncbi:MAG: response regulator [Deltaproteobacteria bacterium]|nr:response regulator [Deltaproteobacteria bacterium]
MDMTNKRLLVIEDEAAIQLTLRTRLESVGFTVLGARNGDDGLSLAREEKPDLIILDLGLPGRDGYSVCRLLKADPRHKAIPILMLTGRSKEADRARGLDCGADAYLTKPFDSADLVETVRRLLQED